MDLNGVVERTVALRAYELNIENIIVELDLDPRLPRALGDAATLQQVLLNLIVNAEQAIQEGCNHGRIRIVTRRLPGEHIGMEICDDGPGIPQEILTHVFEPFFTTKPAGKGTGLGLSIVYGIMQEHGGEISIESQPGHGATVHLRFRALKDAALPSLSPEQRESRSSEILSLPRRAPTTSRQQRILVLEDEPTVAQLIADVLSQEAFHVETLLDSRKALSRLHESDYDLIVCDLKMPHLDGPGIYRLLAQSSHPLQHRLLFVTGDTMSSRTLEFLHSSGLPFLAKPFGVEELKQAVVRRN